MYRRAGLSGWRGTHSLVGGPVGAGEQLVLVAALGGAAEAVDTLVGLLGGEALEGELDGLTLLLVQVVVPIGVSAFRSNCVVRIPDTQLACVCACVFPPGIPRKMDSLPQTQLAVAGGVGVPGGHGHEHLLQPGPLVDEGSERHRGRCVRVVFDARVDWRDNSSVVVVVVRDARYEASKVGKSWN